MDVKIKMKSNRIITKEIAANGVKVIHGKVVSNINPYIEWVKWLSYVPKFEQLRIQELNSKNIEELSLDELSEIKKYKYQNRMLELFKKYGTNVISKKDYMEVYDFMVNQSIYDLMLSKLTLEEIKIAKEKIEFFKGISIDELREKVSIEKNIDIYKDLSMVDSYILHVISEFDYLKGIKKLNKEVYSQIKENDVMRQKSLYYTINPYLKK